MSHLHFQWQDACQALFSYCIYRHLTYPITMPWCLVCHQKFTLKITSINILLQVSKDLKTGTHIASLKRIRSSFLDCEVVIKISSFYINKYHAHLNFTFFFFSYLCKKIVYSNEFTNYVFILRLLDATLLLKTNNLQVLYNLLLENWKVKSHNVSILIVM